MVRDGRPYWLDIQYPLSQAAAQRVDFVDMLNGSEGAAPRMEHQWI
jgi:hypothetical protein